MATRPPIPEPSPEPAPSNPTGAINQTPEPAPTLPNAPSVAETIRCRVLSPIRRSSGKDKKRPERLGIGQEIELAPDEVLEFVELDPPVVEVLPFPNKLSLNTAQVREIALKLGVRLKVAQAIVDLRSSLGGSISTFDQLEGIRRLDVEKARERAELK